MDKMKALSSRRDFIKKSVLLAAAGVAAPTLLNHSRALATPRMTHDDISLAE